MLPKWQRQNWWLLTWKLAGISSTISTEWNQAAATTSKCMSWSSAWQRQLRTQHNVTQPLLAPRPSWPPAPASTLATGALPQGTSPSHSAACPGHKFPQGTVWFPPSLGKTNYFDFSLHRLNKAFFQKFTDYSYFPNQKVVLFYEHILFLFQEQNGTAFIY